MSNLQKDIASLGTGVPLKGVENTHDYTHIISPEARAQGYHITVKTHAGNESEPGDFVEATLHTKHGDRVGKLNGYPGPKGLEVNHASINLSHRGKGLGTALYEALYAHAKNNMGINNAFGGTHSTLAHAAHLRVAQKHGLDYQAKRVSPSTLAGEYDDSFGKYNYSLGKSEGRDSLDFNIPENAADQCGFVTHHQPAFDAAAFLSGKTVDPSLARQALYTANGDIRVAALIAHGLGVTKENLKALEAIEAMSKGEPAGISPPKPQSIVAAVASGEDVAQAVQRAYADNFVMEVQLSGKHSNGTLLAHDEKTHTTWLLKPGSKDPGPAAGVREEKASQSAREACFYNIAKNWGLHEYFARAELLLVDSVPVAALQFLGADYQTLAKLDDKDPNAGRKILGPFLRNGTLHQLAFVDAVLGNADSHANNVMTDGESIKLIDHGASFAGPEFDPAHDKNSFVPAYIRAWAPPTFKDLHWAQQLAYLPRVSEQIEKQLKVWINGIHADELEHTLLQYGIDPSADLDRLANIKTDILVMAADEAINRFWVSV